MMSQRRRTTTPTQLKQFRLHNFACHYGHTLSPGASRAVCDFVTAHAALYLDHIRPWPDADALRFLHGGLQEEEEEAAVVSLTAVILAQGMAIARLQKRTVVHVSDVMVIMETVTAVLGYHRRRRHSTSSSSSSSTSASISNSHHGTTTVTEPQ